MKNPNVTNGNFVPDKVNIKFNVFGPLMLDRIRRHVNSTDIITIHESDGTPIPVTNTGHGLLPTPHRPLHLNKVLVTPNIVKNLISVCQFTNDNDCTIEFDKSGFSVKDLTTRQILLRCDSTGDLYPVHDRSLSLDVTSTQNPSSTSLSLDRHEPPEEHRLSTTISPPRPRHGKPWL